jgi:cobyrinic acid a,c-diamide synthase
MPRLAIGTIQPGADAQIVVWGMMEALRRSGLQVQSFLSRALFPRCQGAASISGLMPRHLDSWLMEPAVCRDLFLRGARTADLALVEGHFDSACGGPCAGGSLETLCEWLNLPRLAVVDAGRLAPCRLPPRPLGVEGLLLDRLASGPAAGRLQTDLESLWGIPVLGAIDRLPEVRRRIRGLPPGSRLPRDVCRQLGDSFTRHWQPQRLWEIAAARELAAVPLAGFAAEPSVSPLGLAVALDEAFQAYFPDALDRLEMRGASVADFSPLHDECLPPGTDVVYLGCGHPERFAAALADNHCMKAALRNHVLSGRRIYAEGGGLAYLCQAMETPEGGFRRMAGIFPAAARLKRRRMPAFPSEVTLARPSWLGRPGERLRGYRNPHWDLEPMGALTGLDLAPEAGRPRVVGSFGAVGSLLHLNFAAQPDLLRHFFHPLRPVRNVADPWAVVGP